MYFGFSDIEQNSKSFVDNVSQEEERQKFMAFMEKYRAKLQIGAACWKMFVNIRVLSCAAEYGSMGGTLFLSQAVFFFVLGDISFSS